jgi:hypothetical protein
MFPQKGESFTLLSKMKLEAKEDHGPDQRKEAELKVAGMRPAMLWSSKAQLEQSFKSINQLRDYLIQFKIKKQTLAN